MFIFLRNTCPSSTLAPDAEKKQSKLRLLGKRAVGQWLNAAVVVCKKSFQFDLLKGKLMFTVC